MPRYVISFPSSAMRFPDEDLPRVAADAHAAMAAAKQAGVYVTSGGIDEDVAPVMVHGDGTVTAETYPSTRDLRGGFTVVEVADAEEAYRWAARFAAACRCAQEVRALQEDPEL